MDSFGSIFNYTSIKSSHDKLFPPDNSSSPAICNPHFFGSQFNHCVLCPLKPHEQCDKSCGTNRQEVEQKDGIKAY